MRGWASSGEVGVREDSQVAWDLRLDGKVRLFLAIWSSWLSCWSCFC